MFKNKSWLPYRQELHAASSTAYTAGCVRLEALDWGSRRLSDISSLVGMMAVTKRNLGEIARRLGGGMAFLFLVYAVPGARAVRTSLRGDAGFSPIPAVRSVACAPNNQVSWRQCPSSGGGGS